MRKHKRNKGRQLWPAVCCLLVVTTLSCAEDDNNNSYPSAITELVEVHTNSEMMATSVLLDNGTTYTIENTYFTADRPDTTYRCMCVYTMASETSINVYQLGLIPAPLPRPCTDFTTHPHDPVKVESVWNVTRYINARIGLLTTGTATHKFSFSEDSTTTSDTGLRTTHISLQHQQPENDSQSYTQTVYFSLPVYVYADLADSIDLAIFTYDGEQHYGLKF